MNFEEKFNLMIETIEENLQSSDRDVCRIVSSKVAEDSRSMMDAFRFITDQTLSKYVKRRRLIAIYNFKKETGCPFEEAASRFGYDDVSTFSRTFKNTFRKSPAKIGKKFKEGPLYLKAVLNGDFKEEHEEVHEEVTEKFGIPEAKYNTVMELLNAKAFYGFSEGNLNIIYRIHKKIGVTISQAAEFVDEYFDVSANYCSSINCAFLYFNSEKKDKFISDFAEDVAELDDYISDEITSFPKLLPGFIYMYNKGWDACTAFEIAKAMDKYDLTVEEADDPLWSLSSEFKYNSEGETIEETVKRYTIEEINSGRLEREFESSMNATSEELVALEDIENIWSEDEDYENCSRDDDEKYDPDNYYYSDDDDEDEFIHDDSWV